MTKTSMQEQINLLENQLKTLQENYTKLEKDKLTVYNLLYQVNKELDEALNNKQTFIASISHELRSPLTAILGYNELLNETLLTDEQKKYLQRLNESAKYLLSLLSDLLDVAKLKESKIELTLQEVDLDKMLINCANIVESRIPKGVEFIVDIPTVSYYVYADKKRMKQIFINLLINATKFTKQGQIIFSLYQINEIDNNKLQIIVDVKDTGLGIPEKIKNRLFQPFQSTDSEEGTGLGLYISQELAHLMGGNITVNSQEGVGTDFRVTLYCKKLNQKIKNLQTNTYLPKATGNYAHLNVLIVEDILLNREYLKEMLKKFFNITADSAENGAIAVEKARKNDYDFILMDMRMPVMDGLEATKKIRLFNPTVPIVCMSANVYREDKYAAKQAGMNDFIEKPLEKSDIESKLLKLIPTQKIKKETPKNIINTNIQEMALAYLMQYFDEPSSKNFLLIAQESLQSYMSSIPLHFAQKNTTALMDDFHAIKGVGSNLGLADMTQKAHKLQNHALHANLQKIEEEKKELLTALNEFLSFKII